MLKSILLAVTVAVITTVVYAQSLSPPNCPAGYQCVPPGYRCILTDPNAAGKQEPYAPPPSNQPLAELPTQWASPTIEIPEDPNHPDPCWSLRLAYMNTRTTEAWWAFQNCLTHHNYNN
jgi:hypothetical protein